MANASVSRLGQVNNAGDAKALFLKVFSGEVLTAFAEKNIMADKVMTRTISSGKSAQFPLTGKIGAEYAFSDSVLAYANVSRGVKSGGFTTYNSGLPDQLEPFKFEELIAYETGVKASLFDNRLQANAAIYYYDYRDQQRQSWHVYVVWYS